MQSVTNLNSSPITVTVCLVICILLQKNENHCSGQNWETGRDGEKHTEKETGIERQTVGGRVLKNREES